MSSPAVTVLIPAYNEEAYVADAIRSVLAQTREDFELIVIDDGSTDQTAAVVGSFESDPRLRMVRHSNRGLAASLNVGIAAAAAPYVALLDADDLWMPTYLERMAAALNADDSAAFAYTEAWWLDQERGRFFKRSTSEQMGAPATPPGDPDAFLIALMPANWLFGLPLLRRAALDEVGGFDESLAACEDYELWIRMLANGFMAVQVPGRLVIRRDRSGSMSKDESGMLQSMRRVYEIAVDQPGVPKRAREIARRRIDEINSVLETVGRGRLPARLALRRWLGRRAKEVLPNHYWYQETPSEVAAAFPGLDWGPR